MSIPTRVRLDYRHSGESRNPVQQMIRLKGGLFSLDTGSRLWHRASLYRLHTPQGGTEVRVVEARHDK